MQTLYRFSLVLRESRDFQMQLSECLLRVSNVCVCRCREASSLVEDVKGLVEELEQEHQMSLINVELVHDELARVYAHSNKAQVISPCVCLYVSVCL